MSNTSHTICNKLISNIKQHNMQHFTQNIKQVTLYMQKKIVKMKLGQLVIGLVCRRLYPMEASMSSLARLRSRDS